MGNAGEENYVQIMAKIFTIAPGLENMGALRSGGQGGAVGDRDREADVAAHERRQVLLALRRRAEFHDVHAGERRHHERGREVEAGGVRRRPGGNSSCGSLRRSAAGGPLPFR